MKSKRPDLNVRNVQTAIYIEFQCNTTLDVSIIKMIKCMPLKLFLSLLFQDAVSNTRKIVRVKYASDLHQFELATVIKLVSRTKVGLHCYISRLSIAVVAFTTQPIMYIEATLQGCVCVDYNIRSAVHYNKLPKPSLLNPSGSISSGLPKSLSAAFCYPNHEQVGVPNRWYCLSLHRQPDCLDVTAPSSLGGAAPKATQPCWCGSCVLCSHSLSCSRELYQLW